MNIEPTKTRRKDETPIYTYFRLTRSALKGREEPEIGERRLLNEFFDEPLTDIDIDIDIDINTDDLFEAPPICIESQQSDREDATPIRNCTWEGSQPEPDDSRLRLGDWLVQRGLINRHQLFAALTYADTNATRIGDAVVTLGYAERGHVEEEVLALFVFSALQEI